LVVRGPGPLGAQALANGGIEGCAIGRAVVRGSGQNVEILPPRRRRATFWSYSDPNVDQPARSRHRSTFWSSA
jgi:hypothetical protein